MLFVGTGPLMPCAVCVRSIRGRFVTSRSNKLLPVSRGATSTKCRSLETQVFTFTRDKPARASACSSPGEQHRAEGPPLLPTHPGFFVLLFTHGAPELELELEHRGDRWTSPSDTGKRGEGAGEDPRNQEAVCVRNAVCGACVKGAKQREHPSVKRTL